MSLRSTSLYAVLAATLLTFCSTSVAEKKKGGHDTASTIAPSLPPKIGRVVGVDETKNKEKGAFLPAAMQASLKKLFPNGKDRDAVEILIQQALNQCDGGHDAAGALFQKAKDKGVSPAILYALLTSPELGAPQKFLADFNAAFLPLNVKSSDPDLAKSLNLDKVLPDEADQKWVLAHLKKISQAKPDALPDLLKRLFKFTQEKNIDKDLAVGWMLSADSSIDPNLLNTKNSAGISMLQAARENWATKAQLSDLSDHWKGSLKELPGIILTPEGEPTDAGKDLVKGIRAMQKADPEGERDPVTAALTSLQAWGKEHKLSFAMKALLVGSPELNLGHECRARLKKVDEFPFLKNLSQMMSEGLSGSDVKGWKAFAESEKIAKHLTALQLLDPKSPEFRTEAIALLGQMDLAGIDRRAVNKLLSSIPGVSLAGPRLAAIDKLIENTPVVRAKTKKGSKEWEELAMDDTVRANIQSRIHDLVGDGKKIKGPITEDVRLQARLKELFDYARENKVPLEALLNHVKSGAVTSKIEEVDTLERLIRPTIALSSIPDATDRALVSENPTVNAFHANRSPVKDEEDALKKAYALRDAMMRDAQLKSLVTAAKDKGYFDPGRKEILETAMAAVPLLEADLDKKPSRKNKDSRASFKRFKKAAATFEPGVLAKVEQKGGLEPEARNSLEAIRNAQGLSWHDLLVAVRKPSSESSEIQKLANEDRLHAIFGDDDKLGTKELTRLADGLLKLEKAKTDQLKAPAKKLADLITDSKLNDAEVVKALEEKKVLSADQIAALKHELELRKAPAPPPGAPAPNEPNTPPAAPDAAPSPAQPEALSAALADQLKLLGLEGQAAIDAIKAIKDNPSGPKLHAAANALFDSKPFTKEHWKNIDAVLASDAFKTGVTEERATRLKKMFEQRQYLKMTEFANRVRGREKMPEDADEREAIIYASSAGIPASAKPAIDALAEFAGTSPLSALELLRADTFAERGVAAGKIISGMPPAKRVELRDKIKNDANHPLKFLEPVLTTLTNDPYHAKGYTGFDPVANPNTGTETEVVTKNAINALHNALKEAHEPGGFIDELVSGSTSGKLGFDSNASKEFVKKAVEKQTALGIAERLARWYQQGKNGDAKMQQWAEFLAAQLTVAGDDPSHRYMYFQPVTTVGSGNKKLGKILKMKIPTGKTATGNDLTAFHKGLTAALDWLDKTGEGTGVAGRLQGVYLTEPPKEGDVETWPYTEEKKTDGGGTG